MYRSVSGPKWPGPEVTKDRSGRILIDRLLKCKAITRYRMQRYTDWLRAWLHYRYTRRAEGLWRMRRHEPGPAIVQCTNFVVFPGFAEIGMTNHRIGPHRTTSDHIGSHRIISDQIWQNCTEMSATATHLLYTSSKPHTGA